MDVIMICLKYRIHAKKHFHFQKFFISFAIKAKIADTRRSIIYKLLFVYVNVENM